MFLWNIAVTSLAEVWIEMADMFQHYIAVPLSLPLRKCGLKSLPSAGVFQPKNVTSLAEVWIEIMSTISLTPSMDVTSLAEVWIEIAIKQKIISETAVTSLAEVWIEILFYSYLGYRVVSLPLRKCGLKSVWQIL